MGVNLLPKYLSVFLTRNTRKKMCWNEQILNTKFTFKETNCSNIEYQIDFVDFCVPNRRKETSLPCSGTCLVCCWLCFKKRTRSSTSFVTWIYFLNILAKWEIACLTKHCTYLLGGLTCFAISLVHVSHCHVFCNFLGIYDSKKMCSLEHMIVLWNKHLKVNTKNFNGTYVRIMFWIYNFCFMQRRSTKFNVIATECIMYLDFSFHIYVMGNMVSWNLTSLHIRRLRLTEHYVVCVNMSFL